MSKKENAHHGKQNNQKMKPYLVMQYLMKNTDENNVLTATKIAIEIEATYGISAERRSVYRDIEEINKAMYMLENGVGISQAEEWLADEPEDDEKFIVYDTVKRGFYARPLQYSVNDIRLLAECVYSAKFLDKSQSKFLVDILCDRVSDKQAQTIKHDVLLADRVRTNNAEVINSITTINEAMSRELGNEKHIPEKISFKYLKYTISDMKKQVERRHGDKYVVSPYALIINDGNYYLLAFDSKDGKFKNYRVDRMKAVSRVGEPREGEKEFDSIDLKTYTQRVFSMYGGNEERVSLCFISPLLDTVIDRFGTKDVIYMKTDDRHFSISVKIEISNQFFGWILGLGKKAYIASPPKVRKQFTEYIDGIRKMYES